MQPILTRLTVTLIMTARIYTIGHSNHTWESFSSLLLDNEIELLVDVRSNPVSRFAPFSNRRTLPSLLKSVGIGYEFMGDRLGGRPADPTMYDSMGKPNYRKVRSLDEFQDAIDQLAEMASLRRAAILCSEGDPTQCHRRLLLGPPLRTASFELLHIMRDGGVCKETQLQKGRVDCQQLQGELGI